MASIYTLQGQMGGPAFLNFPDTDAIGYRTMDWKRQQAGIWSMPPRSVGGVPLGACAACSISSGGLGAAETIARRTMEAGFRLAKALESSEVTLERLASIFLTVPRAERPAALRIALAQGVTPTAAHFLDQAFRIAKDVADPPGMEATTAPPKARYGVAAAAFGLAALGIVLTGFAAGGR